MKRMALCLVIGLIAAVPLLGQVEFHGQVYPLARLTFEQRYLTLPQRFVTLEGRRWGKAVSLYFSTALEYRLGADSVTLDLREVYAEYSTALGDFRFGKQILAWGAADGNNPTDNVNPYDFYYLFLPGTDRKLGNVMATANLYLGPVSLEAVATPIFQPNRLPLGESDFPIMGEAPFEIDMSVEQRPQRDLENSEFGLRAGLPLSFADLSISYFSGFDRMFTPIIGVDPGPPPRPELLRLEYYTTKVFGGDLVTFLGNWTLRAEGAYFLTEDAGGVDHTIRNPYLQYVLQLDRTVENSNLMIQYLGTAITKLNDDSVRIDFTQKWISEEENERDNIPPKMGMPFAAIAQNAVLSTASCNFADGRIGLQANALYELDHKGYMVGGKATFTLEEAFDLELGLVYLGGGDQSRLHTIGEVFSHVYLGMKYSF